MSNRFSCSVQIAVAWCLISFLIVPLAGPDDSCLVAQETTQQAESTPPPAKETPPPAQETPPPAESTDQPAEVVPAAIAPEVLDELRDRKPAPRNDKNIFSPLDLPTPGNVRNAIGLPGEDYWQQEVGYKIETTLDPERDAITGKAQITYTNNSPTVLPYLWFSLEQNLFRSGSDGSKFTPPGSRFNNRIGFEGGYQLGPVYVDGQKLWLSVHDTLGRLDLPTPVASKGGKVVIDLDWSFNIPGYGADRMGIKEYNEGKVYEMAQWYPSVCKFDDVHGWNTLPYLGQGEFYSDFGSYDVSITVPAGHVVCATGSLQNPDAVLSPVQRDRLEQARTSETTVAIRTEDEVGDKAAALLGEKNYTWHFKAEKVRSFAWTSSAATIWDAAGIQWPDGTQTLVQSVYPAESKEAWTQSTQLLRHSILHYSKEWFRYPYPSATNVNGICGGMEYPMIIFCGSSRSAVGLHSVTSHEIGHTWFPMIVNTDERRYAWMDEGFNTFINGYDTYAAFATDAGIETAQTPTSPFGNRGGSRRPSSGSRSTPSRRFAPQDSQPVYLPADQIRPNLLGRLQYFKAGSGLRLLRETILGPERFDPAFKLYISSWAFKSPQPTDFFRCMENAAGENLAWFWRGWFMEDAKLDQAVVSVKSTDSKMTRIELANREEMVMPVFLKIDFDDGSSQEIRLPVYVWYYTNLWTTEIPSEGKSVVGVTIDADNKLPDVDRDNNQWKKPAAPEPVGTPPENG